MADAKYTYSAQIALDKGYMDRELKLLHDMFAKINVQKLDLGSTEEYDKLKLINEKLALLGRNENSQWSELRLKNLEREAQVAVDYLSVLERLGREFKNIKSDVIQGFTPSFGTVAGAAAGGMTAGVPGAIVGTTVDGLLNAANLYHKNDTTGQSWDLPLVYETIANWRYGDETIKTRIEKGINDKSADYHTQIALNDGNRYYEEIKKSREIGADWSFISDEIESNSKNFISPPNSLGVGLGEDSWDFRSYIDKLTNLSDTSHNTFSSMQSDIQTVSTRGLKPLGDGISLTGELLAGEFGISADYALTTFNSGLTGLNTGFGAVSTCANSLFQQTEQGFGNSLMAAQNYQEIGLNDLGLTFGSQLPTQLGIFQSTHDTTFSEMQGVTKASYTKMGLAAHDFFDDVGFQASHVLGGLVTGEIDSLDEAWETLVDGMGSSFDNMLSGLTQSLTNWGTRSLKDLAGAGLRDMLAGLFKIGKGGNLSSAFDSILGSLLKSGRSGSGSDLMMDFFTAGGGGSSLAGDLITDLVNEQFLSEMWTTLSDGASNAITEAASQFGDAVYEVASINEAPIGSEIAAVNAQASAGGGKFMASIGGGTGLLAAGAGLLAFDAMVRFMPGGDPEGIMGGLKKTIGAAFGLTALDSLTPEQAAQKAGSTQGYYSRLAGMDGSPFLSADAASAGWGMDVFGGVMGLTPEEMDLVNLGLSGINEQMDALQDNLAEAARISDDEWAATLERQQEGLLAQTEQLMAINRQYGISVEGLGLQNAAMLELSTASEQMAISLNNLGLAYENSHQHKMDEAAAASDLVGYYQEMAAQVEELSEGAVVLGEDAEDLVGQFMAGQITSERFADSMQKKLLAAMKKAQEEGRLLADQMNAIAEAIESIPTEWSSTVVTNYVSNGDPPEQHHFGGLILHSGGLAASPLARIYGGMTRYHSGAYVSKLARDEVPAVLQRGEFVIRRDSVNAATLPSLRAINASGRPSAGGGDVILNAPLINIEGNLIGDEDSKEDLVREIETRLRSLANSRFRS